MTVTFDKVRKTFDGKQVFSDFSYTLSLQGITALMGPSGCGKTTLLRLLCGLESPDSGTISGVPETYTFLFQENRLLPWASALENVALVSDAETAKNILCKVGLASCAISAAMCCLKSITPCGDTPVFTIFFGSACRRFLQPAALGYSIISV